jgi:hypothetical protein
VTQAGGYELALGCKFCELTITAKQRMCDRRPLCIEYNIGKRHNWKAKNEMFNRKQDRVGSRAPGGKIADFFSWLRGLWAPKYIPQRSRYGDRRPKMAKDSADVKTVDNQERRHHD